MKDRLSCASGSQQNSYGSLNLASFFGQLPAIQSTRHDDVSKQKVDIRDIAQKAQRL